MIAIGLIPNSSAFSLLIKTKAAAPSFIVLAFAAVTVPSLLNAGLKPAILSNFTLNGSSSLSIVILPFLLSITTGTTSFLYLPSVQAFWLRV